MGSSGWPWRFLPWFCWCSGKTPSGLTWIFLGYPGQLLWVLRGAGKDDSPGPDRPGRGDTIQDLADQCGGEGQLFIGALFATWGAIHFSYLSAWLLLPLISILGFLGGGLWALISGFMRAKGWASETISTLLMNYVAILLVSFFVFGPWKDPESANYPQSAPFPDAAILPSFFGSRVHLGALLAIVGLLLFYFVMSRTRWGLEMRAMGINQEAARRSGISTCRYILLLMFIGGGMAGLAGMGEVSAIHGQLRPSLSPGLGYTGFLISWMAMGSPLGIVAAAFLLSIITAGGDILQMTHRIPAAAIHILMALVLFVVLARSTGKRRGR